MIQHKIKQEMFTTPGGPQRGEILTIQDKNNSHVNGQNLRLATKKGCSSKAPGLHLSATHEIEAVGQLVSSPPTQEGASQLDLLLLKSPQPYLDRKAENQPVRRPQKLAPLELPEQVREAQKQKLKFVQQEAKPAPCKKDVILNEPQTNKVKTCVRQGLVKSAVRPSVSTEPSKTQQQKQFPRPQLPHANQKEQNADKHLKDVVCRGTPAPLCSKSAPSHSPLIKSQAKHGREVASQNFSILQQETGRRRLRLRRAQCLDDDQCTSNMSTLSVEEGNVAQGEWQRAERNPRGQPHPGKGIKESPAASWDHGSVRKSHHEKCSQQSARCTLDQQSAEGGRNVQGALDSVKLSASNWRLKRNKPLITKHSNAVPLEQLQL